MTASWIVTVGFLITVLAVTSLRPLAMRFGLVDRPNYRKRHDGNVPLVGGLAIYVGFVATSLLSEPWVERSTGGFILAGGVVVLVGMIDDRREMSPRLRLVAQSSAALILCLSGTTVETLGELFVPGMPIALGIAAIPFTVVATVALINSVNMSDGLDGLAGTQTLISLCGLLLAVAVTGHSGSIAPLLALVGCLAAFLVFNLRSPWRRKAAVFLGDAGSNFLGLALAWLLIEASQGNIGHIMPAAVLWFVSLQVFDTVEIVWRRLLRNRSPFEADREHLHHVFLLAGFTVGETVLAMGLLALGGVIVGILAVALGPPQGAVFFGFLISGTVFLAFILRTWRTMSFLRRSICRRRAVTDRRRRSDNAPWRSFERRSGKDRRATASSAVLCSPNSANASIAAASVAAQAASMPGASSMSESLAGGDEHAQFRYGLGPGIVTNSDLEDPSQSS